MKEDLPFARGAPPNCRAPRLALPLLQRVRQQVRVASQLPAGEVDRLPRVFERQMARDLMPILQYVENVRTAVAAARCANFPETRLGHTLEVNTRGAELRAMKDRLAAAQLLQDFPQLRLRHQPWFHVRLLNLHDRASPGAASAVPRPRGSATRR